MKIGERGQVTIPKALRDELGFTPDTEVRFVVRDGALQIEKEPESRRAAVDRLFGRRRFDRSTDELMQLLRE
jgi:AbrB family looped-hinge helix DNA binding protein